MKVLLINNCHFRRGGAETVYFETAELLLKAGHKVVFLSFEDENNIHTGQPEYFVRRENFFKSVIAYFSNKSAARVIEEVIEKEKPDIAHAHLMWGGMTASIIPVLHKHGIPLVHTAHDYRMICPAYTFKNGRGEICEKCKGEHDAECVKNRCCKGSLVQSAIMAAEMKYRNVRWHPAKVLDGIIYVSQFARNKHLEIDPLFAKTKSFVLYNCTNKAANKEKCRGDYFLYFGRLSHEKGVEMVIDVFRQSPGQRLIVVGTGPLEGTLKNNSAGSSQIEFWGYKKGKELQKIISDANFVIVPSQWYENNPMTIVESYALGTPVIGSDLGGIPEIINDGATGYIFNHESRDSLMDIINAATNITDQEYLNMTENARTFYNNNFTKDGYAAKLVGFYKEVIEQWKSC